MSKLITLVAGLLAACLNVADARDQGRPLIPNTYNLPDYYTNASKAPFSDVTAKRRVYPNLGAVKYIVTLGQSRTAANSASPASPYQVSWANRSSCLNLNPYSGGTAFYTLDDPPLGASATPGYFFAGWHGRLCDELVNNGWRSGNALAFIPIAIAGSSMVEWQSNTEYGPRLLAAASMLTGLGVSPEFVLIQIGQSDCIAGTSQATMEAQMRATITYWRSLPGRSSDKFYITRDSIHDANVTCSAITNAQTAVGGDSNNSVGANADTLTSPTYGDGTHLNTTGNAQMAVLHRTAIMANYPRRRRRRAGRRRTSPVSSRAKRRAAWL